MDNLEKNNGELPAKKELKLTDKQIKFVKAYVKSGGKAGDSYMTVYKVFKEGIAQSAASRLLSQENIKAAIQEELLNLKSLERIDRAWIIEKLKDLAEKAQAEGNNKYLIESLDMLNKMAGFYQQAAQPVATTVQGNMNIMFGNFDTQTNQLNSASINNSFDSDDITNVNYNDLDNLENEEDENLF